MGGGAQGRRVRGRRVRQELVGNEIEFGSGIWNMDKEGYMREVFTALREAVREGKRVKLW